MVAMDVRKPCGVAHGDALAREVVVLGLARHGDVVKLRLGAGGAQGQVCPAGQRAGVCPGAEICAVAPDLYLAARAVVGSLVGMGLACGVGCG